MRRLSLADIAYLARVGNTGPAPFVYNGVHVAAATLSGNDVTSSAIDTTGVDLLVFCTSYFHSSVPAISDSKGNTWTLIQTSGGGGQTTSLIYMCASPTVGAGHTFTFNGIGNGMSIVVMGFTGSGATNTAVNLNTTGGGITSVQPTAITPTTNNQLFVTVLAFNPNNGMAIDSGFSITDQLGYVFLTSMGIAAAFKLQTVAAAENPTWSWAGANTVAVSFATFKR